MSRTGRGWHPTRSRRIVIGVAGVVAVVIGSLVQGAVGVFLILFGAASVLTVVPYSSTSLRRPPGRS